MQNRLLPKSNGYGTHELPETEWNKGLLVAIQHYKEIESHWNQYAKKIGFKYYIDCSEILNLLNDHKRIKFSNWKPDVSKYASHFAVSSSFGTESSYILYNTSLRTIIDVLKDTNIFRNSVITIKPPQSGATTMISAMQMMARTIREDQCDPMNWISVSPNDNSIYRQAKQAANSMLSLYADIRINNIFIGNIIMKETARGLSNNRIHKSHYSFKDDFLKKIVYSDSTYHAAEELIRINDEEVCPITVAVDECHRGSGNKQVTGEMLINAVSLFQRNCKQRKLTLLLMSATPYEVIHHDPDVNIQRTSIWVSDCYCGPTMFEGYPIKVLGDRNNVSKPQILTFDQAFDLYKKFQYKSIDFTISNSYGIGSPRTRFKHFVQQEYNTTLSKLRKEMTNEQFKQVLTRFENYDEYLLQLLKHCILQAFKEQSQNHNHNQFKATAVRLPNNNQLAETIIENLNLPKDITIVRCFGEHGKDKLNKETDNPATLVKKAFEQGKGKLTKFLIVHTGGGRMGVQLPSECQYFLDTTNETKNTDALLQGYYGRGCGHGKKSIYVANRPNIQHMQHVHDTGMSPKRKPSLRSHKNTNSPPFGWLMRKNVQNSNITQLKECIKEIDSVLALHVKSQLKGISPVDFTRNWLEKTSNDKIITNKSLSDCIIKELRNIWQILSDNPHLTTDSQLKPLESVSPLWLAANGKMQDRFVGMFKNNMLDKIPLKLLTTNAKIADSTIGLRFYPNSFVDQSIITIGGSHRPYQTGDVSIKGKNGIPQLQIVWDFDTKGKAVFSGLRYILNTNEANSQQIMPTNQSVYHTTHYLTHDGSFGDNGFYKLKSNQLTATVSLQDNRIIIKRGSIISADEKYNCSNTIKHIRRHIRNVAGKNLRAIRNAGKLQFNQDVIIKRVLQEKQISLHQLGSAFFGANRNARDIWEQTNEF